MCVVSMIGDYWKDRWYKNPWNIYPDKWPDYHPPYEPAPMPDPKFPPIIVPQISKKEFDELKKEVLEMKELLRRAKEYDEKHDEPDCEIDEKMALLRKIAKIVGVELDDVLAPKRKKKDQNKHLCAEAKT